MTATHEKAKTATVRARINPKLKKEVEMILGELGLSVSEAIHIFMKQIKLLNGIPFDIKIPNKVTRKTLDDTNKKKNLVASKNVKDMFKKIGV